jgi:hypothetical protein
MKRGKRDGVVGQGMEVVVQGLLKGHRGVPIRGWVGRGLPRPLQGSARYTGTRSLAIVCLVGQGLDDTVVSGMMREVRKPQVSCAPGWQDVK